MKHFCSIFLFCVLAWLVQSCHKEVVNPNEHLSLAEYDSLNSSAYKLDSHKIWREIRRQMEADSDTLLPDYRVRNYYLKRNQLVWIDRKGIDYRADSLLMALRKVEQMGFNLQRFRFFQIEADLKRMRLLDFDDNKNTINRVVGRLEYNLTKAYLRFATGQRFGFVNPAFLLNHHDIHKSDSVQTSYQTLYAQRGQRPGDRFFKWALHMVHVDSIGWFLRQIEPHGAYYRRFLHLLNSDSVSLYGRKLVLVNLERSRWRLDNMVETQEKYVVVNIPSFQLQAIHAGQVLAMRIGCGSLETKTPLLRSAIKRMDINPQWILPRSIIKKTILPRVGNVSYFRSHRYFVRERKTGKIIRWESVTPAMIESSNYLVIQEGGEGNALGRIVFRFDNGLSIYLHDTSSKEVFSKIDRGVSHGCVRVQYPYELAAFLLGNNNSEILERIRYSMAADVSSLGKRRSELTPEQQAGADTLNRRMLIGSAKVTPAVPLFIVYYTLFPDRNGSIVRYEDVYGYDELVYSVLRNYL